MRRAPLTVFVTVAGMMVLGCVAGPASSGPRGSSPAASESAPASRLDLAAIQAEIESTYKGRFSSVGVGATTVLVSFSSTGEAAARLVKARYGSSVDVTVGMFPFPAGAGLPNGCPAPLVGVDPGRLHATLQMPSRIGHGQFKAQIRVANTGSTNITLDTGSPLLVYLYKVGVTDPVGVFDGAIAGVGLSRTIKAGGSTLIDAVGATASCDIGLGYDLPDGEYVARGVVDNGRGFPVPAFLTDAFPVTIAGNP